MVFIVFNLKVNNNSKIIKRYKMNHKVNNIYYIIGIIIYDVLVYYSIIGIRVYNQSVGTHVQGLLNEI